MSATGYSVTVWVGDWTATIDEDDTGPDQLAAGAVVDTLRISWDSDPAVFPAQPSPTTLNLGLFVPSSSASKPAVFQGQPVSVVVSEPGWTPAAGHPFAEFHGRINACEAEPARNDAGDGIRYTLIGTDYRADLAEESLDRAWPAERAFGYQVSVVKGEPQPISTGTVEHPTRPPDPADVWGRVARIAAESRLPITYQLPDDALSTGELAPRESAAVSTAELLDDALRSAPAWYSFVIPWLWIRAVLVQELAAAAAGRPVLDEYRLAWMQSGVAARPYVLAAGAGSALVRQLRPSSEWPAGVHLPAAAVDRAVSWRQDKSKHANTIRVSGDFYLTRPSTPAEVESNPRVSNVIVYHAAPVAERGPVEKAIDVTAYTVTEAQRAALTYLGSEYDTVPRWTFDEVTIRPQLLPAGERWPRLLDPSGLYGAVDWQQDGPAAGRLVLVTGIPAAWNLHERPDFPGRLVGATVELRKGVVTATARVLHTIPQTHAAAYPDDVPVTADALTANGWGDRVPADFGALTANDLWLTTTP